MEWNTLRGTLQDLRDPNLVAERQRQEKLAIAAWGANDCTCKKWQTEFSLKLDFKNVFQAEYNP